MRLGVRGGGCGAQGKKVAVQTSGVFFGRHGAVQKHQGKTVAVALRQGVVPRHMKAEIRIDLPPPGARHQLPQARALLLTQGGEPAELGAPQPSAIVGELLRGRFAPGFGAWRGRRRGRRLRIACGRVKGGDFAPARQGCRAHVSVITGFALALERDARGLSTVRHTLERIGPILSRTGARHPRSAPLRGRPVCVGGLHRKGARRRVGAMARRTRQRLQMPRGPGSPLQRGCLLIRMRML